MIRFLWLDYRAALGERKVWFAVGIFAYAVLSLPVLLARPPPHVSNAMETWFGARDPFTLFMFMWTDLAMNKLIAKRLLGREETADEAPVNLDEFANTASARSIIAFHRHREDMAVGDHGVICSFGAGYSAGTVFVRKRG